MMTFSDKFKRELMSFIVAGILATATDFLIYWLLQQILPYYVAKTISFLTGSVVAYFLNKFITFKQKQHSMSEAGSFILLYGFTLVINVCVNSLSIMTLAAYFYSHTSVIVLAFLIATGVSTVLNFLGQKYWVFNFSSLNRGANSNG